MRIEALFYHDDVVAIISDAAEDDLGHLSVYVSQDGTIILADSDLMVGVNGWYYASVHVGDSEELRSDIGRVFDCYEDFAEYAASLLAEHAASLNEE